MRQVFHYMRSYLKESILGPLFKLLEATFELFVPLVVANIVDVGIKNGDRGYIARMAGLMVLLGVIGLTCTIAAQYFAAKASVGCTSGLRRALFERITKLDYTTLDELGTSTMVTRLTSDMNQVETGLNLTLRLLLRSPFVVFGAMVMAFTIDAHAAAVFAVTIPALALVVFGIMLVSIPLYKKVQQSLDRVMLSARENLLGVRVLRAFGREKDEIREFEERGDVLAAAQRFVGNISALLNPLTFVIINAAAVVLVWVGAVRVDSGIIETGEVIALYNYMSQILVELVKLANLIINVTRSVASANRIEAIIELPPEKNAASSADAENAATEKTASTPEIAVEFDHVSLRYKNGGGDALSDITFRAMRGETVGVIGGTGSGKSSLVNLIPAFYTATGGEVRVFGENVSECDREKLRRHVAVVAQGAELYSGTIRENIAWGNADATEKEIEDAVRTAQAADVIASKTHGLDERVERGGVNFSGGQRQRLTIARALVRHADILILDDSASALDFATDAALRASLAALDPKPTVFIVSQRTSSIMHADKIIVLEDGECVGIGTHAELLSSCAVYREIHESQHKEASGE